MNISEFINISSFQTLLFTFLVLTKRDKSQSDWFLVSFFFSTFIMAQTIVAIEAPPHQSLYLILLGIPLGYFCLPLIYWYIESHRRRINWSEWYHALPSICVFMVLFIYFNINKLFWRSYDELTYETILLIKSLRYTVLLGLLPFYLYLSLKSLKKHEEYALMQFSYQENVSLSWLNRFIWMMIISWLSGFILVILELRHPQFSLLQSSFPLITCLLISIIYLGIFGIRNNITFSEINLSPSSVDHQLLQPSSQNKTQVHSTANAELPKQELDKKQIEKYKSQLLNCMDNQKPFLNPKLSLKDLAIKANIPYYHLSTILNRHLETSFYDFVNAYRVEEFIKLQTDPKNQEFTILSLAYEAGFNSKSTFYSIFRKMKGVSPSSFIQHTG